MLYVLTVSAPFVAYVHIKLPQFARQSREQLLRWAENIPPSTEIDLTTIKAYGRPRVSRLPLSDLKPIKARFGIQNLTRTQSRIESKPRSWWAQREQRLFSVGDERRKTFEASIWHKVWSQIQKPATLTRSVKTR